MEGNSIKRNGGVPARVGKNFNKEIIEIQDKRLRNGKSKDRVSFEKLSNLVVRHKYWKEVKEHIIQADEEEVNEHGI